MTTLVLTLHFLVCFVLITVVLLQRGKGADMGAALGGGGANTVFGSRGAGNFLTKLTTASAITFMCTSLTLAYYGTERAGVELFSPSDLEQSETAPAATDEFAGESAAAAEDVDIDDLEEITPADLGGEAAEQ
jgi:preprotein translocase subunit SecG